jgi:hypothetical protein
MLVAFFLAVATLISINEGDSCGEALQRLRKEEGLRIEATNTLHRGEQEVLVYTLTKGKKKTAILGCALEETQ